MPKLFAIYVGGSTKDSHIELHDVRFIIADSIEGTYERLRKQWWGTPESLHLDCWAELTHVDGYDIELKSQPFKGKEKLFFVNLGGYENKDFAEAHKNVFVVTTSQEKAKQKALKLIAHW